MIYALFCTNLLTAVVLIVILIKRRKRVRLKRIAFRQTALHNILKDALPTNSELLQQKPSQGKNHRQDNTMKVVTTTDNKAYWVSNNVFYCTDVVNGEFDPSEAKPVNTDNLTKSDIEKLLFILDHLKNG